MATCMTMLPAIGHTVNVRFESMTFECIVLDVKSSYGKARLQVIPESGTGIQWVEVSRVSLKDQSQIERRKA